MTDKGGSDKTLRENPPVAQLIAQGAETAMTLRGFVGPATSDGYVCLYPRLNNLRRDSSGGHPALGRGATVCPWRRDPMGEEGRRHLRGPKHARGAPICPNICQAYCIYCNGACKVE